MAERASSQHKTAQANTVFSANRPNSAARDKRGTSTATTAFDLSLVPVRPRPVIQAKLKIGAQNDACEREADQVAERVTDMRSHAQPHQDGSAYPPQTVLVRTKPAATNNKMNESMAPPAVDAVLATAGQPLNRATRDFMEPRFGYDFSGVRVHTGTRADIATSSIGASAFTAGRDIVFAGGEFAPHTSAGRKLLAHELTHVAQQSGLSNGEVGRSLLQKQDKNKPAPKQENSGAPQPQFDSVSFQKMIQKASAMDKLKRPAVKQLATAYYNRPGKLADFPDAVIENHMYDRSTQYIPGHHEPTYDQIFFAIYKVLDLKKTGKGNKVDDWELKDYPRREKTEKQKDGEILEFGAEQAADGIGKIPGRIAKVASKSLGLVLNPKDTIRDTIVEEGVEWGAKWLTERALVGTAALLTGAGEIYVVGMLLWSVYELAKALEEPQELSPFEESQENIADSVKEWLQNKEEAATIKERLDNPFKTSIKQTERDKTIYRRH